MDIELTAEDIGDTENSIKANGKNPTEKYCNICGESKSSSEFYKHKNSKDGLQNYCIVCCKQTTKNNRTEKSKRCPSCEKIKARNGFYKDKTKSSGLTSWCKVCIAKNQKPREPRFPIRDGDIFPPTGYQEIKREEREWGTIVTLLKPKE